MVTSLLWFASNLAASEFAKDITHYLFKMKGSKIIFKAGIEQSNFVPNILSELS